jgi:NADH-quinone oxidoreductase subunit J
METHLGHLLSTPSLFEGPFRPALTLAQAAGRANTLVSPALVLALCVIAGIGTALLLPSRRESIVRGLGGLVVIVAAAIFIATLIRLAADHGGGMGVYFWVFSIIALAGALRVVTHPRPVYSALYFVLTTFASAGLFILLWAEFMAAALVLIYAGAILVTYVFVIMLAAQAGPDTGNQKSGALGGLAEYDAVSREPLVASAVGFALMGVLLFVIFDRGAAPVPQSPPTPKFTYVVTDPQNQQRLGELAAIDALAAREALESDGSKIVMLEPTASTQGLGFYLFRNQPVNLELAGLMLTLGMIGAIVIARRRVPTGDEPRPASEQDVTVAPMTPINDDPHSIPVYGTTNVRQKAYPET